MSANFVLIALGLVAFGIALIVALDRLLRLSNRIRDRGESIESSGPDDTVHGGD